MKIILTTGDPNGIGIEILAKSLLKIQNDDSFEQCEFTVCGNSRILYEYLQKIKIDSTISENKIELGKKIYSILPCEYYYPVSFGKESADAGKAAAESIEKTLERAIKSEFDALVTMPISKAAIYKSGWKYPGHTEMLADRCNVSTPLMILCTRDVRVALATVHIPISEVSKLLTKELLVNISKQFNDSLIKDYSITPPSIAFLGLNPHSGEAGAMGSEEIKLTTPAINECRRIGINVNGPHPADGFFAHGSYKNYDGIVAMYHDQGLIPLKMIASGAGVNFTAGLPIVRTSPDHGTAFEIAGKGLADETSALEAIRLAIEIANNREKNQNV